MMPVAFQSQLAKAKKSFACHKGKLLLLSLFVLTSMSAVQAQNGGLHFDGVNDFVDCGNGASVNNLSGGLTLEAWVNVSNPGTVNSIIRKTGGYNLYVAGGTLHAEIWPTTGGPAMTIVNGSTPIQAGTWMHVAFAWNGSSATLYVNGAVDASTLLFTSIGGSENLFLGRSSIYGQPFGGVMDEVRIWSRPLSQCELQSNMYCEVNAASQTGIAALYHFNQGIAGGENSGLPGVPSINTVYPGDGQVIVVFDAATDATSYTVMSSPGGFTASGTSSPITVTGLTNGTSYSFTVVANNWQGTSAPSSHSMFVVPVGVPDAPANINATALSGGSASIAFYPPASNGGLPVTSYVVTASPGNMTQTGASSPIMISGLTNGVSYTFTAVAINAAGTSSASVPSNQVVPVGVPDAPSILSVAAASGQVAVEFAQFGSTGGLPIMFYTATVSPGEISVSGSGSPIVVAGLTNGVAYTVSVVAINAAGNGAPSASSSPFVPTGVPGSPTGVSAAISGSAAQVSFSAPSSNGGLPITSYKVVSSPDGLTGTGAASPIMVSGLSAGTTYTFTVVAINAAGNSPLSVASAPVGIATVPGAPTIFSVAAGNAQVTVQFTLPASNGGSPITSYTVVSTPGNLTATGSVSPLTVTGLTNGLAYTFRVRATNAVGTSALSAASASVVPKGPPGAPVMGVISQSGNLGDRASVAFTAPSSNGGSAITSYRITATPGNFSATGAASPIVVTGLTAGVSYRFVGTATNVVGTSVNSNLSALFIPTGRPDAPVISGVVASVGTASVSFVPPFNGASSILSYTITAQPGNITTTVNGSPAAISGLTPGVSYTFTMTASNARGTSPASAAYGPVAIPTTSAASAILLIWQPQFALYVNAVTGFIYNEDDNSETDPRDGSVKVPPHALTSQLIHLDDNNLYLTRDWASGRDDTYRNSYVDLAQSLEFSFDGEAIGSLESVTTYWITTSNYLVNTNDPTNLIDPLTMEIVGSGAYSILQTPAAWIVFGTHKNPLAPGKNDIAFQPARSSSEPVSFLHGPAHTNTTENIEEQQPVASGPVNILDDASGNSNNGQLTNFALNGATSNWVAGTITGTCSPYMAPTATITASGSLSFCAGGSVTLTASAGNSYLWNTGATTQSITVSPASTTTYTVAIATACTVSANITVTVNAAPSITISGATIYNAGGTIGLTASGAATYSWTGPSGFTSNQASISIPAASSSKAGVYQVTGISTDGCTATASTTITVNLVGPAGINTGILTWLDGSDVDADANSANDPATGNSVNTWFDKSGNANNGVALNGAANFRPDATSTINARPVVRFSGGQNYKFNNIDIRAVSKPDVTIITVYKQGNGGNTGLWGNDNGNWDRFMYTRFGGVNGIASRGPGQTPPNTTILNSGIVGNVYLFTGIYDGNVVNGVNNGPVNGSSFYFNGSLLGTFTDRTETSAAQTTLRLGFDGDDGFFVGDVAEFIVYDRVLTACEIQEINNYLSVKYGITFSTAAITPAGATTFCEGGSVMLNASAGTAYQWKRDGTNITSATAASYLATQTGSYTVDVTTICGVVSSAATAVTVNSKPIVSAASNTPVSGASQILLTATGATTYSWTGPNNFTSNTQNPIINNAQTINAGTYNVVGTNGFSCSASASTNVVVNAVPAGALALDGGNDYVKVPDNNLLDFGAGDFTIEAWVKKFGSSVGYSNSGVLSKWNTGALPGTNEWSLATCSGFNGGSNNRPMFIVETSLGTVECGSNADITLNIWNHIAGVRQGNTLRLYVNGVLAATAALPAGAVVRNVGRDLTIGAYRFNSPSESVLYSNMQIDEARIWSRALCADEINNNRNAELLLPQSGLVACYRFNQGFINADNSTVNTLTDASGNNLTGSLQNMTLSGTASNWVAGTITGTAPAYVAPVATIAAATATTFCQGGSVVLNATPATGVSFQWYLNNVAINGATGAGFTANASGSYYVVTSNAGSCSATSNSINVVVNPYPVVSAIAASGNLCNGSSTVITATGASTYSWSNGTTGSSITVNTAGTYSVTGTTNGCATVSNPVTIATGTTPSVGGIDVYQQAFTDANSCSTAVTYPLSIGGSPAPSLSYSFSGATTGTGAGNGSGQVYNKGTTQVTVTATNTCGTGSNSFDIHVLDNVRPTASCKPATIALDAAGHASITAADINNNSTDNCGPVTLSISREGIICGIANENNTVTLQAPAGTVIDRIDFASYGTPSGNCGSFTYGFCHAGNSLSIVNSRALGRNSASIPATNSTFGDPCGGTVKNLRIQAHYSSSTGNAGDFDCSSIGSNSVLLTVTDADGNVSTCTSTVTVVDDIAPIVNNASLAIINGQCSVTAVAPTATDNCAGIVNASTTDAVTYTAQGTYTIHWTYNDGHGNSTTQNQQVIVKDVTAPVPNIASLPAITAECSVSVAAPTASDNCRGTITATTSDATSFAAQGTYSIHWIYNDGNGNTSAQDQSVVIHDVTAPVFGAFTSNVPASIQSRVPEANQYSMVYAYDLPASAAYGNTIAAPTTFNNAAALANVPFSRIAYFMEIDNKWVWVSMDKFTSIVSQTGIPSVGNTFFQQKVNNMNITASTNAGVTTGTGIATGNIEFWNNCYAPANALNIAGANGGLYDFDDSRELASPGCYGSFQVHNWGTRQTLFAYNRWAGGSISDLGIGNNTGSSGHPDWTFQGNANTYAGRKLYVFISGGTGSGLTANTDATSCSAPVAVAAPSATDNCSSAVVTGVRNDGLALTAAYPKGVTTITWTATDAVGNQATRTQTVTVTDNVAPVPTIATLPTLNGQCSVTAIAPKAIDNCAGTVFATTTDPVTYTLQGTYIIHWTYSDADGNKTFQDQQVVVRDITPAVLLGVPANATAECDAVPSAAVVTATDNCSTGAVSYSEIRTNGSCNANYTLTRKWSVTDAGGNVTSATQVVTVRDTKAPVLVVSDIAVTNDAGRCGAIVSFSATATDNCSSVSISYSQNPNTYFPVGSTIVTATAVDACGNTTIKTFVVKVSDNEKPVVRTQNITIQLNAAGAASIVAADIDNGSFDNCAIASVVADKTAFTCTDYGMNTVTLTVTDIHGNVQTATATITVEDHVAPVISCPDALTINCQDDSHPAATGRATASDACGIASITPSDVSTQNADINSTDHYNYTITRTWTATDIHGNSSQCTQVIRVQDITAPAITCPASVTLNCEDNTSVAANGSATGSDICSPVSITSSDVSTQSADINVAAHYNYTITRTWTATDVTGNHTSCDQVIKVQDIIAPAITCPASVTLNCEDNTSIAANGSATGSDICSPVAITSSDVSTQSADIKDAAHYNYTITRTWTATDVTGNRTSCDQTITVQDITAPSVTCPASVTLNCEDNTSIAANGSATGSDICSPVAITSSDVSTQSSDINNAAHYNYTITRTWTATDVTGNHTSCDQIIKVQDVTAPSVTCPASVTLNCEDNTSIAANGSATGSDICSPVAITSSDVSTQSADISDAAHYNYTITRTWIATDVTGNRTSCDQIIKVQDVTAPAITCPASVTLNCEDNTSIAANGSATGSDICSPVAITSSDVSTQSADVNDAAHYNYTITRAWTATDVTGNRTSCDQTITVQDITAPSVTCPASVTLNCQDNTSIAANGSATGSDICSPVAITSTEVSTQNADINNAGQYNYTITRTWTATDVTGNHTSCVQVITVQDVTAPVVATPAASLNATVECSNAAGIASTLALAPSATDNCAPVAIHLVSDVTTNACGTTYTRVRKWNFTDITGNTSALFTQTLTVVDLTAPVVTSNFGSVELCYDTTSTFYSVAPVAGTDNCTAVTYSYTVKGSNGSIIRTGSTANASGTFTVGMNTITWTLKDACGNATVATATVRLNAPITGSFNSFTVSGGNPNTIYTSEYAPAASSTITVTAAGGTAPYTYVWSKTGTAANFTVGANPATITATAVSSGTVVFSVVVTDSKGCKAIFRKTINVVDARCGNKMEKVLVCHGTGSASNPWVQICVAPSAVPAQLGNGSYLGACSGSTARTAPKEETPAVKATVLAYPNPSRGIVQVRLTGMTGKVQLSVVDGNGKTHSVREVTVRYSQEDVTLDLQTAASGIYTIRASNGVNLVSTRVVIAR
jgi:hypothetical protein